MLRASDMSSKILEVKAGMFSIWMVHSMPNLQISCVRNVWTMTFTMSLEVVNTSIHPVKVLTKVR